MPVSVALFASGLGTLIYMVATQFKVPVYLGSSFAFDYGQCSLQWRKWGGSPDAAQTGVVLGWIYFIVVSGYFS